MEQSEIKLFEGQNIRYVWDEEKEQYFFSVVDVIQVLTESAIPRRYWSDLKRKLAAEGSELYEKIVQLKLPSSDGKKYLTDVATTEQLLHLMSNWSTSWERRLFPISAPCISPIHLMNYR